MSRSGSLLPLTWYRDPRIIALSDPAQALYVRLLSWSADQLTDGAVPRRVMDQQTVQLSPDERALVLAELASVGLVGVDAAGYFLVEWQAINLPRAEVEAIKATRRESARIGGLARAATAVRGSTGTFATSVASSEPSSVDAGKTAGRGDSPSSVAPSVAPSVDPAPSPSPSPSPYARLSPPSAPRDVRSSKGRGVRSDPPTSTRRDPLSGARTIRGPDA